MSQIELAKFYPSLKGGTLEPVTAPFPFDGDANFLRPALIIVPGGGYKFVSEREATPVAFAFLAKGFQCFILRYKVTPDAYYPEQLLELSAAVDFVKKHSKEYYVNPKEVFAVGFSAGGHLVGTLANFWSALKKDLNCYYDAKLQGVGMCYAVVSSSLPASSSIKTVIGDNLEKEAIFNKLSLENTVNKKNPPTFIYSTFADKMVDVRHSLFLASSLKENGVPFEIHVYPYGEHGSSIGDKEINTTIEGRRDPRLTRWVEDCATFFHYFCKEEF